MKNFVQKTKLEERQELYEKKEPPLQAKLTRPVFLNEVISQDLQSSSLSHPLHYPNTPHDNLASRVSSKEGRHPKQSTEFLQKQSNFNTIRTHARQNSYEPKKVLLQRRSCCCKWCGGISEFEAKHQDIVSNIEKLDYLPSKKMTYSPIRSKVDNGTRSSFSKALINFDNSDEIQMQSRHKKSAAIEDSEAKLNGMKLSDPKGVNLKRTITEEDRKPTKDFSRFSENKVSEQYKKAFDRSFNLDQEGSEELPIIKEKTPLNKKYSLPKSIIGLQPKQNNFIPVRFKRSFALSPHQATGSEWDLSKEGSGETFPHIQSNTNLTNISTNPGNPTPVHKWRVNPYNAKVIQSLMKNASNYVPTPSDKIRKLTTPISLVSLQERNRNKISKNETLLKDVDPDSKHTLKELLINRTELPPIDNKEKVGEEEEITKVDKSPSNLYLQVTKKLKMRHIGQKGDRKKLHNILKAAKTKILDTYVQDKSDNSLTKKSLSTLKYRPTPSTAALENPPSVDASPIKSGIGKVSFKQALAENEAELKRKTESKSVEPQKSRKKKIRPNQLKELKDPSQISYFPTSIKSSVVIQLDPLNYSPENKIVKHERQHSKNQFENKS